MIKIFIILLISILFIVNATSPTKIRNTLISRTIKLESQLSEQTITITFINGGEKAINKYNYIVAHQEGRLSYIGAENDSGKKLKVIKIEGNFAENGIGYDNYEIELDTQVEPKKAKKLIISLIFVETMSPFPKEIFQDENQLVIYQGNAYVFSLYRSDQQKTIIYLASDRIESYSKDPKPVVHSGKTITFGNYQSLQKFSLKPIKIHFENNMPFTRVKKLEREYLISLWGSVSVEERWEVEHFGAKLRKGFSRFDFVRTGHRSGSVSSFHQFLPKEATNIYYRDIIGNISTSHVFPRKDGSIDFHITPRFVLFGGWRVVFKTGYYLPVSSFLSIPSSQTYNLRTHLFDSIDGFPVDSLTVRVVLPEGSTNPKLDYPFQVDSQGLNGVKKTYLDTTGRPVFEFTKTNVVSQHAVDFDLSFSVEGVSVFKKPFLFVFGIYVVLLGIIFYARWERSIIPPDSVTFVETQRHLENLLLELKDLHCERADLYANVEKQILKAPKVLNKQGLENAISNLEKETQILNKDFAGIENDFKKYNENLSKQLRTLANHEKTRQEIFINTAKSLLQQETEKKREEIQDSFRKKCDEISEVIDKCIHDISDELDIN